MKTNFFFSRLLMVVFSLTSIVYLSACKEDDEDEVPANEVRYTNLVLNGAKEVPANASTSTGMFNGTYNKDTNVLTYTVSWTGFTANNMHFHKAAVTASGPPVVPIAGPYTSPMSGTVTLTADQETDLLAGLWYINIHSAAFGTGEIRVQLMQ